MIGERLKCHILSVKNHCFEFQIKFQGKIIVKAVQTKAKYITIYENPHFLYYRLVLTVCIQKIIDIYRFYKF